MMQMIFGVSRKHFDFKHADEVFGTMDSSVEGVRQT